MAKTLRLYQWHDTWVAATTQSEARRFLLEQYTPAEVSRCKVSPIRGMVDLAYDYGESVFSVNSEDVSAVLAPGIVPQID